MCCCGCHSAASFVEEDSDESKVAEYSSSVLIYQNIPLLYGKKEVKDHVMSAYRLDIAMNKGWVVRVQVTDASDGAFPLDRMVIDKI